MQHANRNQSYFFIVSSNASISNDISPYDESGSCAGEEHLPSVPGPVIGPSPSLSFLTASRGLGGDDRGVCNTCSCFDDTCLYFAATDTGGQDGFASGTLNPRCFSGSVWEGEMDVYVVNARRMPRAGGRESWESDGGRAVGTG